MLQNLLTRTHPATRGNLLIAAIPLALAVITRGLDQLERHIAGRYATLGELDAAIAGRKAELSELLLVGAATPQTAPPADSSPTDDVDAVELDDCGEPFPCEHRGDPADNHPVTPNAFSAPVAAAG